MNKLNKKDSSLKLFKKDLGERIQRDLGEKNEK